MEEKPVPKAAWRVKFTPGVRTNRSCTVLTPALSRSCWLKAATLIGTLETLVPLAALVAVTTTSVTTLPAFESSAARAPPARASAAVMPRAAARAVDDAPAASLPTDLRRPRATTRADWIAP